ncbi:MAG: hypothetical protein RLZZ573_1354, partial [Pseudomonadota bacterium]
MKLQRKWVISGVALVFIAGLIYANRLHVFKYSLGWYTDIMHPREANQPVP